MYDEQKQTSTLAYPHDLFRSSFIIVLLTHSHNSKKTVEIIWCEIFIHHILDCLYHQRPRGKEGKRSRKWPTWWALTMMTRWARWSLGQEVPAARGICLTQWRRNLTRTERGGRQVSDMRVERVILLCCLLLPCFVTFFTLPLKIENNQYTVRIKTYCAVRI